MLALFVWGCLLCCRLVVLLCRSFGCPRRGRFWGRSRLCSALGLPVPVGCGGCGLPVVGGGLVGGRSARGRTSFPGLVCLRLRCGRCGVVGLLVVASFCCRSLRRGGGVGLLCRVVPVLLVGGRVPVGVGCRWSAGCAVGRLVCGRRRCRRSCGRRRCRRLVCVLSCRCRAPLGRWLAAEAFAAAGGVCPPSLV